MRRVGVVVVAMLCVSNLGAQGYRPVKVRSCPYGDSLLGPLRDDSRSEVQGFYHKDRDSTYLLAGSEGSRPPKLNVSIKLEGERPTRDPAAQLVVYMREGNARAIAALDSIPVAIAINDTTAVNPAASAKGTFVGPARFMVIPVSALIRSDDLLTLTQARKIVVNAGPVAVPLSDDERRSIRAILRVAVCPP